MRAFAIWGLKVGCVTAALIAPVVGLGFSLLNLLDAHWALGAVDWLSPGALVPTLRRWGWTGDDSLSLLLSGILNACVFIVSLIAATAVAFWVGRRKGRLGEFSRFGHLCIEIGRGPVTAALVSATAGIVVLVGATLQLLASLVGWMGAAYPLMSGVGLALLACSAATLLRLPVVFSAPEPLPVEPVPASPVIRDARIPGDELVRRIQRSPIYRGQLAFTKCLPRLPRDREGGDAGRRALLERWPLLSGICSQESIDNLTSEQHLALRKLREFESRRARGEAESDLILFGWSGSGRTTVMNLVALGTALHREGSTCWIVPERRDRSVMAADHTSASGRHPFNQLDGWLRNSDYDTLVQRVECYADMKPTDRPKLSSTADIWVSDVKALHGYILDRAAGDARRWIERLRYVVIDHPHRMGREDLVRLRVSLARLRLTAHLYGVDPTFIILSTRLDNAAPFAKELLNNENVDRVAFSGWYPECQVAGWQTAPELIDFEAEHPRFARSHYARGVLDLLSELGVEAHRFGTETAAGKSGMGVEPGAGLPGLRVAVVDTGPLLGPEFREHVREAIRTRIVEEFEASSPSEESVARIADQWAYYLTPDLAIDERQLFDVIVCLGIGAHPEMLLAGLRPALATRGAIVFVGDCSQADVESLRRMRNQNWDPHGPIKTGTDDPELPAPEASEPVTAYELARLFEDFHRRPVPRDRLESMFGRQHASAWIDRWTAAGLIEPCHIFSWKGHGARPLPESCLVNTGGTLAGSQYEVPWGCCTRDVYRILDIDAGRRDELFGRYHDSHLDLDRLFVDFYPGAVLRFPPNTVEVRSRKDSAVDAQEHNRYVHRGDVEVRTTLLGPALNIDRRIPRFRTELKAEHALHVGAEINQSQAVLLASHPVMPTLVGGAEPEALESRLQIVKQLRSPLLRGTPQARLISGTWRCVLREQLRDVVATEARLVEDPDLVNVTPLSADQADQMVREFEGVVSSFYLRRSEFNDAVPAAAAHYFASDRLQSYAAHHGLGRMIRSYFRRKVLGFDGEYRLALAENGTTAGDLSRWRIFFYGLRQSELGEDPHIGAKLTDKGWLETILDWAHERLERCDCADGCSMCCGGLGTLSLDEWKESAGRYGPKFTEDDTVTRRGAYYLTCLLLGKEPDWRAFKEGNRGGTEGDDPVVSDGDLQGLVAEVIGTPSGQYRDGVWTQIFGDRMPLPVDRVAAAGWMPGGDSDGVAGLYFSGTNQVQVRKGLPPIVTRQVILHEYVHNWQFQAPTGFDQEEHCNSEESKRFFEGKLVIEGHARWSETQFRFHRGLSPSHTPDDPVRWDEYKSGYFLMEGIVKAVGEHGMFVWLAEGRDATEQSVRSRVPALSWPFSLTDAMRTIRPAGEQGQSLMEISRGGKFTSWDVGEAPGTKPNETP